MLAASHIATAPRAADWSLRPVDGRSCEGRAADWRSAAACAGLVAALLAVAVSAEHNSACTRGFVYEGHIPGLDKGSPDKVQTDKTLTDNMQFAARLKPE